MSAVLQQTAPSGVLVIDKPTDWTSHDVVAKVRSLLKTKKVGHTGTLDPMGTGVLPICIGDATKVAGYAQMADKVYEASLKLGIETDTQDRTGTVTATQVIADDVDWDARIREAITGFIGEIEQIPPMYSAIKIAGEALYKKARRGEDIERPARQVTLYDICDVRVEMPHVHFTVACSKGTYIRTLAADLGSALGVGAHLTALNRKSCGPVTLQGAISLEQLADSVRDNSVSEVLHGEDYLLFDLPALRVSEYTAQRMLQGIAPHVSEWTVETRDNEIGTPPSLAPGTLCRAYGEERGFFALVEASSDPAFPSRIRRIIKTARQ